MKYTSNRNTREETSFPRSFICEKCGMRRMNRIAVRPPSRPPFPLDQLQELAGGGEGDLP